MSNTLAQMDLTGSQGRVVGFISHQADPPCAKDIEEEFQLSHPTVSGILGRLERKGFIEFFPDPEDRRCKRIILREKGRQCLALMDETIRENEQRMVRDFTPEEQRQFSELLERAIINMGGNPCQRFDKEESNFND